MAGAVDTSQITGTVQSLAWQGLNIVGLFVIIIISAGIATGVFFLIRRWRRYYIPVTIFDYTTTPRTIAFDRGGIFKDHITKNTLFWLKIRKIGLSPDNIPYIPTEKGRSVFVVRYGLKNFSYWTPPDNKDLDFKRSIGQEDVQNALNQYKRGRQLLNNSLLNQILVIAPIAFLTFSLLVILIIIFKFAPDLIREMTNLANVMREAYQTQCGTTVITP